MPEPLTTVTSTVRPELSAPKPAAAAVAPAPVVPAPPAPAEKTGEPADPLAALKAELKTKQDALELRERKFRNELKKNAEEKEGLSSKLKRGEEAAKRAAELEAKLAEREKEDRLAGLNPVSVFEKHLGKDWVKRANELAATGVPPADLIAEGMQRVEERLLKAIEDREQKARAASEEQEQSSLAQQERAYQELKQHAAAEGADFYREKADSYPIFAFRKLSHEQVGQMLADRIEYVARTTGQEMTYEQAADAIEAEALALAEFTVGAEKYKGRLQEKFKPAIVPPSSGVQGVPGSTRRTLGNHLTASTSDRAPPKTAEERRNRAIEAYDAVVAKRTRS